MKRLLARLLPLAAMLAFASPAWAGEMTVRGTAIAPDAPGAAPTPTPVPLPRSVSDRLGWARRSLSSASLARLDRLGGPLPAGIAAGFTFPLLRERAQREVASAYPLLGNADVASTALVVLAMAAGDLDEDLRRLGLEVDSMESARRKLEERRTELRARLAADAAGRTTEAAARRERARRTTARWRAFVPERAATSHAHLEFTEAPGMAAPPPPPPPPPGPRHRHLGDRMRDRPPRHRGAPRLAARLPGDGDPAPAPLRGATRPIRRGTLGGGSRQNRTLGDPGTRPSLNGDGARRTDALPGGSAAELRGS